MQLRPRHGAALTVAAALVLSPTAALPAVADHDGTAARTSHVTVATHDADCVRWLMRWYGRWAARDGEPIRRASPFAGRTFDRWVDRAPWREDHAPDPVPTVDEPPAVDEPLTPAEPPSPVEPPADDAPGDDPGNQSGDRPEPEDDAADAPASPAPTAPAPAPTSTPTPTGVPTTPANPGTTDPALAAEVQTVLDRHNQYRYARGLAPLEYSPAMSAVSQAWTERMASNGRLVHNPDYAEQLPRGWSRIAENIAYNSWSGTEGAGRAVDQWINSSGHERNMTGAYSHIGIGLAAGDGVTFYTVNFGTYRTAP